ncbi:UNVERIFIED_CONTAM: hypothetical protein K2H54_040619 [Gekko kuhli]
MAGVSFGANRLELLASYQEVIAEDSPTDWLSKASVFMFAAKRALCLEPQQSPCSRLALITTGDIAMDGVHFKFSE